jgi:DNA-binding NarL/FixJ family response regulator
MIRVLVVDDHAVVRRGLKHLFAESGDISVAGEATSAEEALEKIRRSRWDVAVIDINLPDRDGLELIEQARIANPKLPLLVLTMYAEEQFAVRAVRLGAAGYVTKESAPEELMQAVRKVASGGRYVSPSLGERLARLVYGDAEQLPHETLSSREFQVFRLLAAGRPVSAAAAELCLSVKTVSTYRTRILEKLDLKSNADLTLYAVRNRLID